MTHLEFPDADAGDTDILAGEVAEIVLPASGSNGLDPTDGGAAVSSWQVQPLARPNVPDLATVGIWRVSGKSWSAVLKVLREPDESGAWAAHPDPRHPFYWRREAEVFARLADRPRHARASRLPDTSDPAGLGGLADDDEAPAIRMPLCYGVFDRANGSVALWMEDVRGTSATQWDLPRYGLFARQLAAFHAGPVSTAVTVGRPPEVTADRSAHENDGRSGQNGEPSLGSEHDSGQSGWLGHGWLRTYVGRRESIGEVPTDPRVWRHPAVREVLDADHADQFAELWQRRHDYLAEVEAQPRVLCHLDLHPLNLFDVQGRTVLIDWAFCGLGGLGEDLGTLALDAVCDFHLAPDRLPELFDILVTNYAAASPTYDEPTVWRAVAVAALARFAWLAPALIAALFEEREQLNGRPLAAATPAWGRACHFLLDLAAEVDAVPAGDLGR